MADEQDIRRWVASAVALTRLPAVGSEVFYFPQGHAEQWNLPAPEAAPTMLACTVASVEFFPAGDEPYARVFLVPAAHVNEPVADTRPDAGTFTYYPKLLVQGDIQRSYLSIPKACADSLLPLFEAGSNRQEVAMSDVSGQPFEFVYKAAGRKRELGGQWAKLVHDKKLHVDDSALLIRRSDHRLFLEGRCQQPPVDHGAQDPGVELAESSLLAAQGDAFGVTFYPARGGSFVVPRGAVEDAMGKHWEVDMEVRIRANDRVVHAVEEEDAQLEPVIRRISAVSTESVWRNLTVTSGVSGAATTKSMWDVEVIGAQPPAAKRARTIAADAVATAPKQPVKSVRLMGVVLKATSDTGS